MDSVDRTRDVPPAANALEIRLLGAFQVTLGSRVIGPDGWRLRKAAHLLKLLALAPDLRLHREQIQDILWPDLPPAAAANNLRVTLHAARRTLAGGTQVGLAYLPMYGEYVALVSEPAPWIDVVAFEAAVAAARRSGRPVDFEAALRLYTGDLLPDDCYEQWTITRRESLRAQYLEVLLSLAYVHETLGHDEGAVACLEQAVERDPANEEAHAALMRLYVYSGRRTLALRQYHRLREVLRVELDIEPSQEITRLYDAIVAGRVPPRPRPPRPVEPYRLSGRQGIPAQLQAYSAAATNIPPDLTSFVGRQREIAAVKEMLAEARLLTLTGPGGCGKTRLGLRVARDLVESYPDGVWLVDLSALASPALVPQAVATTLHIPELSSRSVVDLLVTALRDRRSLLVLDNCEHVVEAAASLVEALLRGCRSLQILATSREPLRVPGEVVWAVPGLKVPSAANRLPLEELREVEAVQLFVERAALKRPGFTLSEEDAPAVVAICRQLDGLPLAIELAATRIRAMPVQQLAERVGDALHVLTSRGGSGPERQQTLRATIDWSYRLLTDDEQRLLRRLSVFAGGFTIDAVEEVAARQDGGGTPVLDLLFQLIDRSLVTIEERDREVRYRLLHTIQQFAWERLVESGEAIMVCDRYLDYFIRLVEQAEPALWGPDQAVWLRRLEAEHDNLRSVLERALKRAPEAGLRLVASLWWFWRVRGYFTEGRRWLDAFVARPAGPAPLRARALLGAGILAAFQGDRAAARPYLEESHALSRDLGDRRGVGWALANLGLLSLAAEDYGRAAADLEAGLDLLLAEGDQPGVGWTLDLLGDLARVRGEYARADDLYGRSLSVRRQIGDRRGAGWALIKMANVARIQGDYRRAEHLFAEYHALSGEIDDRWDIGWALGYEGILAWVTGDDARACTLLEQSVTAFRDVGDQLGNAYCLYFYGAVLINREAYERGVRLVAAADAQRKPLGIWLTEEERAAVERTLARARRALGERAYAREWEAGRTMSLEQAVDLALPVEPA